MGKDKKVVILPKEGYEVIYSLPTSPTIFCTTFSSFIGPSRASIEAFLEEFIDALYVWDMGFIGFSY